MTYTTLDYITLHYITLYYITLHYMTFYNLNNITLHTLHNITQDILRYSCYTIPVNYDTCKIKPNTLSEKLHSLIRYITER